MPLLVPPPTVSEFELQGLPSDALVTLLKQEVSNWIKLCESNEEMKMMIEQTLLGQETNEGIQLDQSDVALLQEACHENTEVIDRKASLIENIKSVLVEKGGEHAVPNEVMQEQQKWKAIMQDISSQGITL